MYVTGDKPAARMHGYRGVMGCSVQCLEGKSHVQSLHLPVTEVNSDLQVSVKVMARAEIETLNQNTNQRDVFITMQKEGCLRCKARRKLGVQRRL